MLGIIFFFLSSISFAEEPDFSGKGDISLAGEYREFPQSGLGVYDSAFEAIFKSNYQSKISYSLFRLEITPEVRGFQSRVLKSPSTDIGYASVKSPQRLMNLAAEWKSASSQWVLDMERLNLVSTFGDIELQVGRKPIGVGTLKVLPVWNKFSRPLPNTAGPNFIFGQDSGILRWQSGNYSFQAIDVEGKEAKSVDAVRWLEGILYDPEIELHLMASKWWENNSLGVAFAKDISGATLRGEGLWIGFDKADANRETQAGLGVEYALNETWTLLSEGIYFEKGASAPSKYSLSLSKYRPLRAKGYVYLQANSQLTPFWNLNLATMVNVVDASLYPLLKLSRSLSDNWELIFDARFPVGASGDEFSRKTFSFTGGRYAGAPSQYMVQLNTSF